MYKLFSKYGLLIAFVVGLVFTLIAIIPAFTSLPDGFSIMDMEEQVKTTAFDTGLKVTIGLFFAAIIITILVSVLGILKNPKAAIKGVIGIAVLVVLIFVLYSTSPVDSSPGYQAFLDEFNVSDNLSRWIDAGLKSSYILTAVAVGVMVLGEVRNLFK